MSFALALPAIATVKDFLTSRKFLIPAAIALFLLAVAGGVYRHLNEQTEERVAAAVTTVNTTATTKTLEANNRVQTKNAKVDTKVIKLRVQTAKDYTSARKQVESAPEPDQKAPVPPLIIDTLNELNRLREDRDRDEGGVPDPTVSDGRTDLQGTTDWPSPVFGDG